jgi:UDP-glucose 4-epimerase
VPHDWDIVALYNRDVSFPAYLTGIGKSGGVSRKCDLTDEKAVRSLSHDVGQSFDACLFLAANGDPTRSVEAPGYDWAVNVGTLLNVLNIFHFNRFLFVSSGAVYDGHQGYVSPESSLNPRLPYAISKLACEHYVQFYHKKGTIQEYLTLRLFGAYGPYEPPRKIYTQLVKAFCFDRKKEFTVKGDGMNLIDAIYVSDAMDALTKAVMSDSKNLTLDLCYGSAMTLNELVASAATIFGIDDVRVNHVGNVAEYIQFRASPKNVRKILDSHPRFNLEDGLTRLASFLRGRQ